MTWSNAVSVMRAIPWGAMRRDPMMRYFLAVFVLMITARLVWPYLPLAWQWLTMGYVFWLWMSFTVGFAVLARMWVMWVVGTLLFAWLGLGVYLGQLSL